MRLIPDYPPAMRRFPWPWFIAGLVALGLCAISLRAAPTCPVIRFDCLTNAVSTNLNGFPPFIQDARNPAIYFQRRVDITNFISRHFYNADQPGPNGFRIAQEDDEYRDHIEDIATYNPQTGVGPTTNTWNGKRTDDFYFRMDQGALDGCLDSASVTNSVQCESTRTGLFTWSTNGCLQTVNAPTVSLTVQPTSYVWTRGTNDTSYHYGNCALGAGTNIVQSTLRKELTNGVTLNQVVQTLSNSLAADWPDWTNATRNASADRGGINIMSVTDEDHASFHARLSAFKYRVAVFGPKDEQTTVSWREIFVPNGGGPVVTLRTFNVDVTFTGEEQYLEIESGTTERIVDPPSEAGLITLADQPVGSCASGNCRQPGRDDYDGGAFNWRIHLGTTANGDPAGFLYARSDSYHSSLATPQSLKVFSSHSEEVLRGGDGNIRQVKAAQTLADIVTTAGSSYEVRLYPATSGKDANGLYIPSGAATHTWKVAERTSPTRLVLEQSGPSGSRTNQFWSSTTATGRKWALLRDGLSREFTVWAFAGVFSTQTTTIQTPLPVNGSVSQDGTAVSREEKIWKAIGDSPDVQNRLVEQRVGHASGPAVTAWTYDENPTNTSSYRKVLSVVHPSGYWERYEYTNGLISRITAQFLNSTNGDPANVHRVTLHSYVPLAGTADNGLLLTNLPRTTIQTIQGNEVARSYRIVTTNEIVEIRRVAPGTGWTTNDLFTTNRSYSVDGFDGTVDVVIRPDGTVQITRQSLIRDGVSSSEIVFAGAGNADGTAVLDGTQTTTITGADGRTQSRETRDIVAGVAGAVLAGETFSYPDDLTVIAQYLDGTTNTILYDCCGLQSETGRDGLVTSYTYDTLRRLTTETRAGITLRYGYDAAGNVLATYRRGTNGVETTLSTASYDLAGRQYALANALGYATVTEQNSAGTLRAITQANNATTIEDYAQDGTLLRVTGTAARPVRFTNFIASDGGINALVRQEIKLDASGNDTGEWIKSFTDMLGRTYKTVYPDDATHQSFFNARGQRTRTVDADNVTVSHGYNARGESAFVTNGSRVTWTSNFTTAAHGYAVRRTMVLAQTAGGAFVTNAFSDTALTAQIGWEVQSGRTNKSVSENLGGEQRRVTQTWPDQSQTVSLFTQGRLVAVTRLDPLGAQVGRVDYTHDSLGRRLTATDARTGTTTNSHDAADQLLSITTPAPALNSQPQTLSFAYDRLGNRTNVVYPDGASVTNRLSLAGDLVQVAGERTYPAGFTYDAHGRMTGMTNWTNFASAGGSRLTSWTNHSQRGWLQSKRDAQSQGADYEYTPAGRVTKRTWARATPRLATSYTYDAGGQLQSVTHGDATAPLAFTYDERGRVKSVAQGTTTNSYTWNDANQLLREDYVSGPLAGVAITNAFDALGRRTSVALNSQPSTLNSFAYDHASRLRIVSNGVASADYAYLANSPLIEEIRFRHSGVLRLGSFRSYDKLNRLTELASLSSGGARFSFGYGYNLAGQRTNVTWADNSRWQLGYDRLGQVTSGVRRWSDGVRVAGQQFEYLFDDIGNRTQTRAGGDASGAGLRVASYSANTLNQYTQREVPGTNDIIGTAPTNATVKINGSTAYQRSNYWQSTITANNSTGAVWLVVTNQALTNGVAQSTTTGNLFVAKSPETFGYDLDGNLTNDGRWSYTWDAENRLTRMLARTDLPGAAQRALTFTNDWLGRRISKTVSNWTGAAWSTASELRFIYDGWNLLAEFEGSNLVRSYTWGLDASGTMQGAGGVGGLLSMTVHTGTNAGTYLYCYDGNHNVVGLVNAASGEFAAQYEYGPFHELLRATGPLARENPFLAATKFYDWETDLYYYGYRYYSPSLGRWLNADPIGESGGMNLFGFVENDPANALDPLGLWEFTIFGYHFGDVPEGIDASGNVTYVPFVNPGLRPEPITRDRITLAEYIRDQATTDESIYISVDPVSGVLQLAGNIRDTTEFVLELTPQNTMSVIATGKSLSGRNASGGERTFCAAMSVPALKLGGKAFQLSGAILKKLNGKSAKEIEKILAKECCVVGAKNFARGFEHILPFEDFNSARDAARKLANLGDDAIPFIQEIGELKGKVTGRMSPDTLRGWRVDWNGSTGFHVNWWDRTGGKNRSDWVYGANTVPGKTYDQFLDLVEHAFPHP